MILRGQIKECLRRSLPVGRVLALLALLMSAAIPISSHGRSLDAMSDLAFSPARESKKSSIKNTIGVITLSEGLKESDRIRFFNEDGSLWYELSFYENSPDARFTQTRTSFRPFAFHQDYFLLVLKCVSLTSTSFKVVVNEETELTKLIKRNDPIFKFQRWEKHLLHLFSVRFDPVKNPLRLAPGEYAPSIRATDTSFHPVQVKGKWLKVRWDVAGGRRQGGKVKYGWVKWKEQMVLQVEFFYFA